MAAAGRQQAAQRPQLLQAAISAMSQADIREKLLFTFALVVIFRFVSNVPVPGVDPLALDQAFKQSTVLGFMNIFSGGALANMSVAAMGVYPYITSSIVMQLMVPLVPALQALSKEGEQGRKQINIYTHWMTVPMCLVQGYGQLIIVQSISPGAIPQPSLTGPDALTTLSAIITMTAGTMFLVWIGELISEKGIGNGISILIFAGIIAGLPQFIGGRLYTGTGEGITATFFLALMMVSLVAFIVYFQEAQRKIPVQYSRSVFRSGRMYRQSGQTHIPLRVNSTGMIPLIFALSVVILPAFIGSALASSDNSVMANLGDFLQTVFDPGNAGYWIFVFVTVVIFTFFYTIVVFQQQNLAENLQRQGGFIPGIRPGRPTQEYISRVLLRITWGGAFFLGTVAIAPFLMSQAIGGAGGLSQQGGTAAFGITASGLIIVVGVVLDTLRQIEAQLLMRQYEGFIR
ncbi:MAG TPA: preprotein translocase subunit SecY [Dehalococcoidia bacterium]|nr:preprotein translocase subunit SecY [Dehalococcoidia bacterium]